MTPEEAQHKRLQEFKANFTLKEWETLRVDPQFAKYTNAGEYDFAWERYLELFGGHGE